MTWLVPFIAIVAGVLFVIAAVTSTSLSGRLGWLGLALLDAVILLSAIGVE